jgi:hypothetical protein
MDDCHFSYIKIYEKKPWHLRVLYLNFILKFSISTLAVRMIIYENFGNKYTQLLLLASTFDFEHLEEHYLLFFSAKKKRVGRGEK